MKYLFVTVKRVGKKLPAMNDYACYMERLRSTFYDTENKICKEVYETDIHGRLHLHMILLVDDLYQWDTLKFYKRNWHVHTILIKTVEDLERVSSYLDKDDGFTKWEKRLRDGEYLFQ